MEYRLVNFSCNMHFFGYYRHKIDNKLNIVLYTECDACINKYSVQSKSMLMPSAFCLTIYDN